MKKSFMSYIVACMAFLIMHTACDQGADQYLPSSAVNDDNKIATRSDCEACPGAEECCCYVWLQPTGTFADLSFCGTSNGVTACLGSATGNCPAFTGGGLAVMLSDMEPRKPFCVNEDSPFYIRNNSLSLPALIIITCQGDIFPPDTMWLQIPPNTIVYVETNSSCEVGPCL